MSTKPTKKSPDQELELLQEKIIKLEKQLESFQRSNDHFLKNKLFLHYDIKEPEKVIVECETKLPVLKEVEKKKIEKGKTEDPTHLIIEGDNYHALSVLNYTHAGKIDLIYIDPPYNTGNKDFIYNDRYVDKEDSYRHSKWLSFMEYRLRLAKNLLAETGVIFISIDDNEQAHLRLLCDQIFGEENFFSSVCVKMSHLSGVKMSHLEKKLPKLKEYLLVYAKNKYTLDLQPVYENVDVNKSFSRYKSFLIRDEKKPNDITKWKVIPISKAMKEADIDTEDKVAVNEFYLKNANNIFRTARNRSEQFTSLPKDDLFRDVETATGLKKIAYKAEEIVFVSSKLRGEADEASLVQPLGDIWTDIGINNLHNEGGVNFRNGKKPMKLIERVILMLPKKDSVILDFFAGSGTTGHAVLKLNAQDSGKRQFILCTNNENQIAENVTYPRIKKVIEGCGDTAGIPANLRYFQTDFVEKTGSVSQLKLDLTRRCAEMLCVKENVFERVKLKKSAKNYQFFKRGNKYLAVFFDFFTDPEFGDFIAELKKLPREAEKVVYIFVLDGSASIFADEFADVTNCEIKEIPQKMLDIYKQLGRVVTKT